MDGALPAHGYEAVYRKKQQYSNDEVRRLPVNAWNEIGEALVADPRGRLVVATGLVVDGCRFEEVAPVYPGPAEMWAALRTLTGQVTTLGESVIAAARIHER